MLDLVEVALGVTRLERREVAGRSCSSNQDFVSSSAGKTAPVAPSSAIMFAIVPRSV